jgi:hypothetical protein
MRLNTQKLQTYYLSKAHEAHLSSLPAHGSLFY